MQLQRGCGSYGRRVSLKEEAVIMEVMAAFFAIFYIDDVYLASRDPEFL
jgi:hypothetical protein